MSAAVEHADASPPLRLVIRSKSHGVEFLGGPTSRDASSGEAATTALPTLEPADAGLRSRTLLAVAPNGSRVATNGGGAPLSVTDASSLESVILPADTAVVERFAFSPLGTFLLTWQRADAAKFPDGSLRVWRARDGSFVRSLHCKQLKKTGLDGTLAWSGDERVAFHCVTNTVHVLSSTEAAAAADAEDDATSSLFRSLGAVRCEDVAAVAVSPAPRAPYGLAVFVPELKGRPASVKTTAYPFPGNSNNATTAAAEKDAAATPDAKFAWTCAKSFFRAQDVTIRWSPGGHAILAQTHTDVDATGGSYYGGTGLYLLSATSDFECLVPLPKEGPVADARWEPTKGREFIVIAGTTPAAAALYDLEARPLYSFGAAHRNVVSWSPHGRFLALCGFGNLAGDVDFWDVKKKKKLHTRNIPCAVDYGWAPDSRSFLAATLAPRMNVDNAVRIYRYDGTGPVVVKEDRAPLFECRWLPTPAALYPDRGPSPASKARLAQAAASSTSSSAVGSTAAADGAASRLPRGGPAADAKPAAYVPPAARGRGSTLAAQMRAERDGQFGGSGKVTKPFGGGVPGAASKGGPPGAAVPGLAPPTESRNKKRKEAQRKRKEAAEAEAQLAQAEAATAAPDEGPKPANGGGPSATAAELTQDELLKKQKGLKKKLKAVAELRAKVDAGAVVPSADQREKLDRAAGLEAELADVEAKLAEL